MFNKWVIGSIAFLIVLSVACVWWYHYDTAPDRREAADSAKLVREWEKSQKVGTDSEAEQAAEQTPVESEMQSAEKPINKRTTVTGNTEPTQAEVPAKNAETAEVRVSPFGFGPYPELPADFPYQDLFDPPYYAEDPNHPYKDEPNYELMDRLWVELWKRGEKVEGFGTMESTGLFYPTIRGTIYVKWGPRWKVFGHEAGRKIRYVDGHPDDIKRLEAAETEDDIPSDLKVLDISEGIDPFTFLDLPKPK